MHVRRIQGGLRYKKQFILKGIGSVQINTTRFGAVEISENSILYFDKGIPGFEQLKRFTVIVHERTEPIDWLQAIDDPAISLPVVSPFIIRPAYSIEVDDEELALIGTAKEEDILVFVVCVLPEDIKKITANLAAPILINTRNNRAMQVVIESTIENAIRYPAFDALCNYYGEKKNACSDKKTE